MINRIKLCPNEEEFSIKTAEELKVLLLERGIKVVDGDPDVIIPIGGDGSFLACVKQHNYSNKAPYIGINCGTLGFLQEVMPTKLNEFIEDLKNGNYSTQRLHLVEGKITDTNSKEFEFLALNEFVVKGQEHRVLKADIEINGEIFEHFGGDGKIFCTSTGSTAYSLSAGGSAVYTGFETLQMTSSNELISNAFACMPRSVILPGDVNICVKLQGSKYVRFVSDSAEKYKGEIEQLTIKLSNSYIERLKVGSVTFVSQLWEKFIENK